MDYVYQLTAFCGEYDASYTVILMVDTDLQRVNAAKDSLRAAVRIADVEGPNLVNQLAYEASVGNLQVQVDRIRVGVLGAGIMECVGTEDWASQEYLDEMQRVMDNTA
jgi:hypothetical protein